MRVDDVPDSIVKRGAPRKPRARFWTVGVAVVVVFLVAFSFRPMLESGVQFLVNEWLVERFDDLRWVHKELATLRLWPWADR